MTLDLHYRGVDVLTSSDVETVIDRMLCAEDDNARLRAVIARCVPYVERCDRYAELTEDDEPTKLLLADIEQLDCPRQQALTEGCG